MERQLKTVLIFFIIILTVICGLIIIVMNPYNNIKENTVITVNGEVEKSYKAELSSFYPGNTQVCNISLKGKSSNDFYITLNFRDVEGDLQKYINVKIIVDNIVFERNLSDLFTDDEIHLGKNVQNIKICYTMPEDTGNESQGLYAKFYIDFVASNGD